VLEINLKDGVREFLPGERVPGKASWRLETAEEKMLVSLLWYTSGKGDRDAAVVKSLEFRGTPSDSVSFEFELPLYPYSFSGKLISLVWAVELATPGGEAARKEIVVSPSKREIDLYREKA